MTGGQVLPAIQVDLIGRNLFNNNLQAQYVTVQQDRRARLLSSVRSGAKKCLFGQSDPVETQRLYNECIENGRQRLINNYDFDIYTERMCSTVAQVTDVIANHTNAITSHTNSVSEQLVNASNNTDNTKSIIITNSETTDDVQERLGNQLELKEEQNNGQEFLKLPQNQHPSHQLKLCVADNEESFEKMCNLNCSDDLKVKKKKIPRPHPYAKITDYFPKTKIVSTKKA